ncbi:thiamine pyrophosphokinase [Nemania sp. FL0916]|nr:thiamine pyrophosphokinase [Nemania sp. FL0916]
MSSQPKPPKSEVIEWHPIRQLLGHPGYEFTLITLNQPIQDPSMFRDLWSSAQTKIAADGGANHIHNLRDDDSSSVEKSEEFKDLDVIIGDLDSLRETASSYFSRSRIIRDPDQYSTDFAKAVHLARSESPGRAIVCMGGLGGRVDQGLSQVHHLYLFQKSPTYADGRMYLISGDSLSFVLKGGQKHEIHVREGDDIEVNSSMCRLSVDLFAKHVGIIPVGEAAVISTQGLEWDVQDWSTAFGGQMSTSNHVLPDTKIVEIQSDKDVLFTIALKQA